MTTTQKRVLLNSLAGACTTAATAAGALGYLEAAAVLASAASFFLGWANFTKPGEIAITKLPPEVQAAVSNAPPPAEDVDVKTPPPTGLA